jgi:hypothetical protein
MSKNDSDSLMDKGGTASRLWRTLSNAWAEVYVTGAIIVEVIYLTPVLLVFGVRMALSLRNLILFGDKSNEQKDSNS